jgi:hypothetical protein
LNEWNLIHTHRAFINDYLLTLSNTRRLRDRQMLGTVNKLAAAGKCTRSHRFPPLMQYDTTMSGYETTIY